MNYGFQLQSFIVLLFLKTCIIVVAYSVSGAQQGYSVIQIHLYYFWNYFPSQDTNYNSLGYTLDLLLLSITLNNIHARGEGERVMALESL